MLSLRGGAGAAHTLCHEAAVHRAEDVRQELGRVLLRAANAPAVSQGMTHECGEWCHNVERGRARLHVGLMKGTKTVTHEAHHWRWRSQVVSKGPGMEHALEDRAHVARVPEVRKTLRMAGCSDGVGHEPLQSWPSKVQGTRAVSQLLDYTPRARCGRQSPHPIQVRGRHELFLGVEATPDAA